MFECVDDLKEYAESFCQSSDELSILNNAWGVDNVMQSINNQKTQNYKFYNIFEPVYFKMLANYYCAALMHIAYSRALRETNGDWKKADKTSKAIETTFDKFVNNQRFAN